MFSKRDRRYFSEMTTEECKDLFKSKGTCLSRYTMGQILEMKILGDMVYVTSKDSETVCADISVEDINRWKNS